MSLELNRSHRLQVHTSINKTVWKTINKMAVDKGVDKYEVLNTLLLKAMKGVNMKGYGKKAGTKKSVKKTTPKVKK